MMTDFLTDTKTSSIVCWYCYPALLQYVAISVIWLLPHNAMLAQYVLWLCVCLSVYLSQVRVLWQQLDMSLCNQHCMVV